MASTEVTVSLLDFSLTSLSSYAGLYAKVIDSVFTPSECASLIELATTAGDWQPAGLSTNQETQTVHTDFRHSDRVLVFNTDTAAMIYERLRPYLEEIQEIAPGGRCACVTGKTERKQGPTWRMSGVNSRLSFLRYGPGQYFKPHCDGLNDVLIDGVVHKSFVTLHLYLNDDGLEGGATRFWTPDKKHWLDVHPKIGRVLIFQQRLLVHSGEEVTKGEKYTMRSDFLFEQVDP